MSSRKLLDSRMSSGKKDSDFARESIARTDNSPSVIEIREERSELEEAYVGRKQTWVQHRRTVLEAMCDAHMKLVQRKVMWRINLMASFMTKVRSPPCTTLSDRTLVGSGMARWKLAFTQRVRDNALHAKADKYLKLNNQIKMKLIMYKLRKITKRQRETVENLQLQFFKKRWLKGSLRRWNEYATKEVKIERLINSRI